MDQPRLPLLPCLFTALLATTPTLRAETTSPIAASTLAGTWRLDPERSDDGREKLRDAMGRGPDGPGGPGGGGRPGGAGGRPGGAGGGGWGGGGHHGGGGGPSPTGGGREGRRGTGGGVREAAEAPRSLTVTASPAEVKLDGGADSPRVLPVDGKKHETDLGEGKLSTRARWDGLKLVVETDTPHDLVIRETYEASPDGKILTVLVHLEGGRLAKKVQILRVYDRAEATPAESTHD